MRLNLTAELGGPADRIVSAFDYSSGYALWGERSRNSATSRHLFASCSAGVKIKLITSPQDRDQRGRRHDHNRQGRVQTHLWCISIIGKGAKSMARDGIADRFMAKEHAGRQVTQRRLMADLPAAPRFNPRAVQYAIHIWRFLSRPKSPFPRIAESVVGLPSAICTRAVPGAERDCFIMKEKLCPVATRHHGPFASLPVKGAANPGFVGPSGFAERPIGAVQNAPIAGECPARMGRDDLAIRLNAILQGHGTSLTILGLRCQHARKCLSRNYALIPPALSPDPDWQARLRGGCEGSVRKMDGTNFSKMTAVDTMRP